MKLLRRVRVFGVPLVTVSLMVLIPACRPPTAEQVVARVERAMAGAGRIGDLRTLRVEMTYPDHPDVVITEVGRPNRLRTENVGRSILVFDGQSGAFLKRPPSADGTLQTPALIEAGYLKDFELDIAFVFPAFFDHPSEYLGRETVEGIDTHKLAVTLPLGVRTIYFVDAKTYLPVKVVADVTVDGTEYHPGRVFHGYSDWGGMMYPQTVTYWWTPDKVDTAVVNRVEVNPALDEDRFIIPAAIGH